VKFWDRLTNKALGMRRYRFGIRDLNTGRTATYLGTTNLPASYGYELAERLTGTDGWEQPTVTFWTLENE